MKKIQIFKETTSACFQSLKNFSPQELLIIHKITSQLLIEKNLFLSIEKKIFLFVLLSCIAFLIYSLNPYKINVLVLKKLKG